MSCSTLLQFGTTEIVLVSVFGALLLGFIIYLCFVPLKNYFTALFSGAYIPTFRLISIKNRKLVVANIVNSYVMAKKSKLEISLKEIESLSLSGGDVVAVITSLNLAKNSGINLSFELASAIELASQEVLQKVQDSITSQVVTIDNIRAFTQNEVEIIASAKISIKLNLDKFVNGLGLDDLKSIINSWILENISKTKDHKDIMREPNKALLSNLDLRVVTQKSMFNVLDINIVSVEMGRNLNTEKEVQSLEKEKAYASIEAERRKNAEEIKEIRMRAKTEEMKSALLDAEADVPRAISQAIKEGRFSVMDYYKLMNLQADTAMRRAIINSKANDDDYDDDDDEGDFF